MTAALLREFMPYGAPELQDAARPHMVRALALSSLIASLAFAVAWAVVLTLPHDGRIATPMPERRDLMDVALRQILQPPPPIEPVEIAEPRSVAAVDAMPVPARDTPENLERTIPTQGDRQGDPSATRTSDIGEIAPPEQPINQPGEFIPADQLPEPVRAVKPTYPDLAWQAHVEGLVMVQVLIGKDGRVQEVRLDPKKNVPLLNEAALEAARQWVFTPALSNNHPVSVWMSVPFRFTLR